ncbi:MAG: threonine synthase, partial [Oscillospiraceae bacterium]|nr:threonine synthase [Oscillospiraceae bacterium]
GRYEIDAETLEKIGSVFSAGSLDDEAAKAVIRETFSEKGYLLDTHTAVAFGVTKAYREKTGDKTKTVTLSTASPFKFTPAVLSALGKPCEKPGPELIGELSRTAGIPAPRPLADLAGRKARFTFCAKKTELFDTVKAFLS